MNMAGVPPSSSEPGPVAAMSAAALRNIRMSASDFSVCTIFQALVMVCQRRTPKRNTGTASAISRKRCLQAPRPHCFITGNARRPKIAVLNVSSATSIAMPCTALNAVSWSNAITTIVDTRSRKPRLLVVCTVLYPFPTPATNAPIGPPKVAFPLPLVTKKTPRQASASAAINNSVLMKPKGTLGNLSCCCSCSFFWLDWMCLFRRSPKRQAKITGSSDAKDRRSPMRKITSAKARITSADDMLLAALATTEKKAGRDG
mmetsp:Transcript_78177/g.154957  ORF Transcript_78177/g.154957 Transcript_78177/m.154957 type:complete len:259 (+) Transcript_78177:508-1284(+)